MCGIAGFSSLSKSHNDHGAAHLETLVAMRKHLAHRGGAQAGEILFDHAGLAHTSRDFIDPEAGRQPMTRRRDGAAFSIVCDGEIYNAGELREELAALGASFETTGGAEVILEGYILLGDSILYRLNGVFAFAIWDEGRSRLLLARDRSGAKPLFYAEAEGELIFASEIKALFAHPSLTPRVDMDSLREILAVGPACTDGEGVFCGVRQVRMGCLLTWDADGLREEPYWRLVSHPHEDSYVMTRDRVGELVRDAVRRQTTCDASLCAFLSGGLDSSVVTALACEAYERSGRTLNTFSFDFAGNDEHFSANAFQPERDRPYVEELVPLLGVNHTYLTCDESGLTALLDDAAKARDLPGMADVDASLLAFCRMAAKRGKVALTGECADEVFGGYPWFYRPELMNAQGFPWASDMSMREALLRDDVIHDLRLGDHARRRCEESLAAMPRLPGESPLAVRQREISWLTLNWFMPTLLTRMDRIGMIAGIQARVPFADHRIVEYLWNVPFCMKRRGDCEKSLLRDAMRGLLPDRVLWRKKSPYPKTYDPGYAQALKTRLNAILDDPASPLLALIDPGKARRFMEGPLQTGKPWFGQLMAAPQLVAYFIQIDTWMRKFHLSI